MHSVESTPFAAASVPLAEAIVGCLVVEEDRGLLPRTLKQLERYLLELVEDLGKRGVASSAALSPVVVSESVRRCCQGKGPATAKAVIWAMRKLSGYLLLQEAVRIDPARALISPRVPRRERLPEYLSVEQLRSLLTTAAQRRPGRDFVILSLLASTGLRTEEITSLRWSDVQPAQRLLGVRVKGNWWKTTPLNPSMAALLAELQRSQEGQEEVVFRGSKAGQAISVSSLQRMVRRAGEEVDLPFRLTPRHLRHTFATYVADRHGKPITQALLGHRGLRTTDVYAHLSPRRFQALMGRHPYPSRRANDAC